VPKIWPLTPWRELRDRQPVGSGSVRAGDHRRGDRRYLQQLPRFLSWAGAIRRRANDQERPLVFSVPNTPGSLYQALGQFATRQVNLTKLESRRRNRTWQYVFYVDLARPLAGCECQRCHRRAVKSGGVSSNCWAATRRPALWSTRRRRARLRCCELEQLRGEVMAQGPGFGEKVLEKWRRPSDDRCHETRSNPPLTSGL
jgi:hypothetical protein